MKMSVWIVRWHTYNGWTLLLCTHTSSISYSSSLKPKLSTAPFPIMCVKADTAVKEFPRLQEQLRDKFTRTCWRLRIIPSFSELTCCRHVRRLAILVHFSTCYSHVVVAIIARTRWTSIVNDLLLNSGLLSRLVPHHECRPQSILPMPWRSYVCRMSEI